MFLFRGVLAAALVWGLFQSWGMTAGVRVKADFDGSGQVDFKDFLMFARIFGATPDAPGWDVRFDLEEDGRIDFGDFTAFAAQFGRRYRTLTNSTTVDLHGARLVVPDRTLAISIEISSQVTHDALQTGADPPDFEGVGRFYLLETEDDRLREPVALILPYRASEMSRRTEDLVAAFWDGTRWTEIAGQVDTGAVRVETSRLTGVWTLRFRSEWLAALAVSKMAFISTRDGASEIYVRVPSENPYF